MHRRMRRAPDAAGKVDGDGVEGVIDAAALQQLGRRQHDEAGDDADQDRRVVLHHGAWGRDADQACIVQWSQSCWGSLEAWPPRESNCSCAEYDSLFPALAHWRRCGCGFCVWPRAGSMHATTLGCCIAVHLSRACMWYRSAVLLPQDHSGMGSHFPTASRTAGVCSSHSSVWPGAAPT